VIGGKADHRAPQRLYVMLGKTDGAPGDGVSGIQRQRPAEVAARLLGRCRASGEEAGQVMLEMSTGPWRNTIHFLVSGRNSMP
jgi:hypothetical protein